SGLSPRATGRRRRDRPAEPGWHRPPGGAIVRGGDRLMPLTVGGVAVPNRTYAARAAAAGIPEPSRVFSQQDWRTRRRRRLVTEALTEPFSVSREVADVAVPLAQRIAGLAARDDGRVNAPPTSMRFHKLVIDFADAVYAAMAGLLTWNDQ